MRSALSRLARWLASPRLALGLLFALVLLVFLATLVPQGGPATPRSLSGRPRTRSPRQSLASFGFHSAYTSPVFLACALLLALSTTVCSWRRTKVAAYRLALVRSMTREQAQSLVRRPTFSVELQAGTRPPRSRPSRRRCASGARSSPSGDGYVGGGASRLGILGSPVFHWALVLVFVVLVWGQLTRAEGLMGVAEGEIKPNTQQSYGLIDSGALYRWRADLPVDRRREGPLRQRRGRHRPRADPDGRALRPERGGPRARRGLSQQPAQVQVVHRAPERLRTRGGRLVGHVRRGSRSGRPTCSSTSRTPSRAARHPARSS